MKKIILIVDDDRLTLATAQKLLDGEYKVVAVTGLQVSGEAYAGPDSSGYQYAGNRRL